MSEIAIKFENVSKQYRLGEIGTGTLSHDLNRWFHKIRGLEDPYLKIAETNDRAHHGKSDYVWALRDIDFEVKKGQVLGIIGRNGAGKSTLLKILSKVTRPTTGLIKTKGRIASLLEVGTGFHQEMTGRENVYMNGSIMGMTKAEITSRFDKIVDFAGVERYIDTPVKRYSSGMTVRLGFAIAAHLEPEILVVDEVLAVGDAEFQKKSIGKMGSVAKEGRTILFVSHNMSAIEGLCETGIYLENGKIIGQGDIHEQINLYLKSSTEQSKKNLNGIVKLGAGIILTRFEITPNPIESGDILYFHLEIESEQSITSDSLVLLFYSSMGGRVAIVDLRLPQTQFKIAKDEPLVIGGKIDDIPFVEGEYNVGIFFASSLITNNYLNLLNLTVLPPKISGVNIPYSPNVRGLVNLRYTFQTQK